MKAIKTSGKRLNESNKDVRQEAKRDDVSDMNVSDRGRFGRGSIMKRKWYKLGAVVIMIVLTALSAILWPAKGVSKELRNVTCADDLAGAKIGGVKSYMGAEASKIYFQSLLGRDVSGYREYDSFEDAVEGLREGEVDGIWACDVTAGYASKKYGLKILDSKDMSATANLAAPRFSFAFAMADTPENKLLKEKLDTGLTEIIKDGTVRNLVNDYVTKASEIGKFYEEDMWSRGDRFRSNNEISGSINIGITGATPPLDYIDEYGRPCGFCVAFLDELACELCTDINIEILDTDTAFTQLMSGRVDALLTGAASGNTTQEQKKFLTSIGYLEMYNYKFLVREPVTDEQGTDEPVTD